MRLTWVNLHAAVARCLAHLQQEPAVRGLLCWVLGRPMPFPMDLGVQRFEEVRLALASQDAQAFEHAALAVVGLGCGLTPSGDDFLGGIFYANWWYLQTMERSSAGQARETRRRCVYLRRMSRRVLRACCEHSHPRSAQIMGDLVRGVSQGALQAMMQALACNDARGIAQAARAVQAIGSSSGADMLAGVLTYLQTYHDTNQTLHTHPGARRHQRGHRRAQRFA